MVILQGGSGKGLIGFGKLLFMSRKDDRGLLVGLDIGTTKVVVLVGVTNESGKVDVVGIGSSPSHGLKRGVVVNIDSTVKSIRHAIDEAELMAGCSIHSAFVGISGGHIKSTNSNGIVAIREREVTPLDVERVIDAAKAIAFPADQKILHILPQEFVIDGQDGIKEPIGMSGVRLETKVHIVTGSVSAAQNMVKCVERCGLMVSDLILQQLASSVAVLTDDERELGVCLIDIGGGTTDIAVFINGAICHSAVIPIAGDQVTNDLAVALRTSTKNAEEIKVKYASLIEQSLQGASIKITSNSDLAQAKEVSGQLLTEVVEARYEELFNLVLYELKRSGFGNVFGAGVVITGGGSRIEGLLGLAERVFQLPVRLGAPEGIGGMLEVMNNPIYATGVGLLLMAEQRASQNNVERSIFSESKGLWSKMKSWFQSNF